MTFHVFVTTPRAGFAGAVIPYTVECKEVFAERGEAQVFAGARVMSTGVRGLLDAMPSGWAPWEVGTAQAPVAYKLGELRSHTGASWKCDQAHSAAGDPNWAPGIAQSLWTKVQPVGYTAWAAQVWYALPSQATDGPNGYQLIQPHRSQVRPRDFPAGWQNIGAASVIVPYPRALWWVVENTAPDYTEVERAKEV